MSASAPCNADPATWISEHDPLPVVAWHDPIVSAGGFDPRSEYVETYWLAVVGPSCVLAARRFADWLAANPDGIEIPLEDLGRSLGLGGGTGRHAALVRTLERLARFRLAAISRHGYAVRTAFPPLVRRQIERLPNCLAAHHDDDLRRLRSRNGPRIAPP